MKLNIKYLLLTISLFVCIQTTISAQSNTKFSDVNFDATSLSEVGKQAYENLQNTKIFTLSGFGAVAAPHKSTRDLSKLLAEKEAEKALQSLIRTATPEGQIYGLLGLQVIKSEKFNDDFAVYKTLFSKTERQSEEIGSSDGGCDPDTTNVKRTEIIKDLESGVLSERFSYIFDVEKLRKQGSQ